MRVGLVESRGQTKGTEYFVKPELLRALDFKGKTNLRAIEPRRLKELILHDMKIYRKSRIGEIHGRIGKEIPRHKVKRALAEFIKEGILRLEGVRGGGRYALEQNM
jgi:ATP-dependent DNA helicase RecG